MTNKANPTPDVYRGVTPSLAFKDAAAAIQWYEKVFGATVVTRMDMPGGKVGHAELALAGGRFMLSDEFPGINAPPATPGGAPITLNFFVADVDGTVNGAAAAGATLVFAVADQFYGHRSGRIIDPFGYVWIISTVIEELSTQEMQQRAVEWMKTMGG